MKKTLLLLFAITSAGVVIYSQRAAIAMNVMSIGLETAMTSNTISEREDGLHIALCGAGGPLPDPNRSGACVAVIAGKQLFIVDAGTNGVRNLARMRYPVGEIQAVLLTHFHSDHIDGLGELATLAWVQSGRTEPLAVIGPKGVSKVIDGFNMAYAQDAVYCNDHHGNRVAPSSGHGMTSLSFDLPENGETTTVYEADDLKIEMLAVDHAPVNPAVGYLFTYKGRTALVSGDTDKSANIEKFARGIDLLVHEALAPNLVGLIQRAANKTGNENLAKITSDILDYHATPIEAAETARNAEVGHLLYYHVLPPLIFPGAEAAWLEGVDEIFTEYTLGRDGTAISMPAHSNELIRTSAGF
jgi:ribonuclease Z